MARFPYPSWEDKNFTAVGKPTINVLKLLSYSSATVDQWCAIGNAQFTRLALAKKNRELVILLSSAKFGSVYEWTHHIPISARFGVTDIQREELLKAGKTKGYFSEAYWMRNKAGFTQKERLLLTFLEAVVDVGEVDESVWEKTSEAFSKREIVEIISMQVGVLFCVR
jgi:alkylhydroperoxidase family enzyme